MPKDLIGSGRLRVGVNPQDTSNFIARICGEDAANPQHLVLEYYANSANAPTQDFRKARGTVAVPANVAVGDRIIDIRATPRSTTFQLSGAIRSYVDAAVVAGQNPASRLEFETNANNAASQANAAIFSNGFLVLGNAKVARGVTESLGLLNLGGNGTVEAYLERASADTTPARFAMRKTRGTLAAPADVAVGDYLGYIAGEGRSTNVFETASMRMAVDAAVVAGQRPASRIEWYTNAVNTAPSANMALFNNGDLVIGFGKVARGATEAAGLLHVGADGSADIYTERASTDASGAQFVVRKSRGTLAAPTIVADADVLGEFRGSAYNGAAFQGVASMRVMVAGVVTNAQRPPTAFEFQTNISNAVATTKMIIDTGATGLVGISNNLFSATERPAAHLHILGEGAADLHLHLEKCVGDASGPLFEAFKARGTVAARANVAINDTVMTLEGFAYSTTYKDGAVLKFVVDAAVVAGQAPASRMEFYTNANNVAPTIRANLNSAGFFVWGTSGASQATGFAGFPSDGHIIACDSGEGAQHLYLQRASTANGPNITHRRSRGSFAALANVVDGDRMIRLAGMAYSGATGFWDTARIDSFVDGAVVDNQRPGSMLSFLTNAVNAAVTERLQITGVGNFGFNTSSYGASSVGVIGIGNRTTAPTGNPTAGSVLYAEAGATKIRGSGGTTTTIANADPHCPNCGRDYMKEYEHDGSKFAQGYFAVCLACLADAYEAKNGPQNWILRAKLPPTDPNTAPVVKKDPAAAKLPDVKGP